MGTVSGIGTGFGAMSGLKEGRVEVGTNLCIIGFTSSWGAGGRGGVAIIPAPSNIPPFDFILSKFSFSFAAFAAFWASIMAALDVVLVDIDLTVVWSCFTRAAFRSAASFSVRLSPSIPPRFCTLPCISALIAASCLAVCSLSIFNSSSWFPPAVTFLSGERRRSLEGE